VDFTAGRAKPAIVVHYLPVVDRIFLPEPLDPLWAMLFLAAFLAAVVATVRRPSYGIFFSICVQPFPLDHYLFNTTVTFPKVVLLGMLLGLCAQPGWRSALREAPVRRIFVALAAVACVVAVTIAVALHRGPAVRETFKWLEYAALFLAVCVAYRRDRNDSLLLYGWTGVTLAVSLLALLQEGIGAPWALSMSGAIVPRIAGPLGGPNQLAAYYEIALAALCAWYVRDRFVAGTIIVAFCALALTFSRGGIAGAAIAIGTIFIARTSARRALFAPVAAGAVLAAACAGFWDALAHVPGLLPQPPSANYAGGVGHRSELWRAAIFFWRRHPLLGIGAGNYELELAQAGIAGVRTHANSWYLQALAEGGIALFLATLALVVTLLRTLASKLNEAAPWQIAALAASLALILHQVVDYLVFYPKVAGPWWILVALGASSIRRSSPKPA